MPKTYPLGRNLGRYARAEHPEDWRIGNFWFSHCGGYLWIFLPDESDEATYLPGRKRKEYVLHRCPLRGHCNPDERVQWTWNGDREKPELKPSIHIFTSHGTIWHGFIRDGQIESC